MAWFLAVIALVIIYSQAKNIIITKSKKKRKPKAYFQFWAFHLFALVFLTYTVYLNYQISYTDIMLPCGLMANVLLTWIVFWLDIETPTHCCRCSQCFCISHSILLIISAFLLLTFTAYFIFSIPTIILAYYLYPTENLVHLLLIINAVLCINSLLALLLFQCERCCHPCTRHCVAKNPTFTSLRSCLTTCKSRYRRRQLTAGTTANELQETQPLLVQEPPDKQQDGPPQWFQHTAILKGLLYILEKIKRPINAESPTLEERAENHDQYYGHIYDSLEKKNCLVCVTYFCQPIGTLFILILFVYFAFMIYELLELHRQSSDSDLKLLLTLVLALVLLLRYHFKLYGFFDIKKENSKEELLQVILQELRDSSSQPIEPPCSPFEQQMGVSIQDQPTGMSLQDQTHEFDSFPTEKSRPLL